MIGFIEGSVLNIDPLIISAGGLGYEVRVSQNALASFQKGQKISLWIYTCMRQDSLELYGFSSSKEKEVFLSLLKVKGIGPKMAIKVLGSCSWNQFLNMIKEENIKALSALPKIGKKTAQQIVLSLKEHISDEQVIGSKQSHSHSEQLLYSLERLGFHSIEIKEVMGKIQWTEDLKSNLKQALGLLKTNKIAK